MKNNKVKKYSFTRKIKDNFDIIYILFTLLITVASIHVSFLFAMVNCSLLAVIGVFFIPFYLGANLFKHRVDERARHIMNFASTVAFNITIMIAQIFVFLNILFNVKITVEFISIIVIVGWLSYSTCIAYTRRVS